MYQAKHYAENEKSSGKIPMILSVAVCVIILITLGILAWALPQPT